MWNWNIYILLQAVLFWGCIAGDNPAQGTNIDLHEHDILNLDPFSKLNSIGVCLYGLTKKEPACLNEDKFAVIKIVVAEASSSTGTSPDKQKNMERFVFSLQEGQSAEIEFGTTHLSVIIPSLLNGNLDLLDFIYMFSKLGTTICTSTFSQDAMRLLSLSTDILKVLPSKDLDADFVNSIHFSLFQCEGKSVFFNKLWTNSILSFKSALSLCDKTDYLCTASIHANIALAQEQLSEYENAKSNWESSVVAYSQSQEIHLEDQKAVIGGGRSLTNLGKILTKLGCPCSAKEQYEKALSLFSLAYDSKSSNIKQLKSYLSVVTAAIRQNSETLSTTLSKTCSDDDNECKDSLNAVECITEVNSVCKLTLLSSSPSTTATDSTSSKVRMVLTGLLVLVFIGFSLFLFVTKLVKLIDEARKIVFKRYLLKPPPTIPSPTPTPKNSKDGVSASHEDRDFVTRKDSAKSVAPWIPDAGSSETPLAVSLADGANGVDAVDYANGVAVVESSFLQSNSSESNDDILFGSDISPHILVGRKVLESAAVTPARSPLASTVSPSSTGNRCEVIGDIDHVWVEDDDDKSDLAVASSVDYRKSTNGGSPARASSVSKQQRREQREKAAISAAALAERPRFSSSPMRAKTKPSPARDGLDAHLKYGLLNDKSRETDFSSPGSKEGTPNRSRHTSVDDRLTVGSPSYSLPTVASFHNMVKPRETPSPDTRATSPSKRHKLITDSTSGQESHHLTPTSASLLTVMRSTEDHSPESTRLPSPSKRLRITDGSLGSEPHHLVATSASIYGRRDPVSADGSEHPRMSFALAHDIKKRLPEPDFLAQQKALKAEKGRQRLAELALKQREEREARRRQEEEEALQRELKAKKDREEALARLNSTRERQERVRLEIEKRGLSKRMEAAARTAMVNRLTQQLHFITETNEKFRLIEKELRPHEKIIEKAVKNVISMFKEDPNMHQEALRVLKMIENRNRLVGDAHGSAAKAVTALSSIDRENISTTGDEFRDAVVSVERAVVLCNRRAAVSEEAERNIRSLERRIRALQESTRMEKLLEQRQKAAQEAELAFQKASEKLESISKDTLLEIERTAKIAAKRLQEVEEQRTVERERHVKEEAEARAKATAEAEAKTLQMQVEAKKLEEQTLAMLEQQRKAQEEDMRLKKKVEAEEEARKTAEAKARLEAEEKARVEAEEKARLEVVEKARLEAVEKARLEAEEKARLEAEEKARLEAEEKARLEAEEKARLEAEEKVRLEAEEKARLEAEEKARLEAEEKARLEAEEKARLEAEEKARLEAEEKARFEAGEKARLEAEEKARLEAEEKVRLEAEEKARLEVEEKARLEADGKARLEAEEKARLEAEEKARVVVVAKEEVVLSQEEQDRLEQEQLEAEEREMRELAEARIKAEEEKLRQAAAKLEEKKKKTVTELKPPEPKKKEEVHLKPVEQNSASLSKSGTNWGSLQKMVNSADNPEQSSSLALEVNLNRVVSDKDVLAEERERRRKEAEKEEERAEKERQRIAAEEELVRQKNERIREQVEEEARKKEEEKERSREAARLKAKKFEEQRAARLAQATSSGSSAASTSAVLPPAPEGENGNSSNESKSPSKWGKLKSLRNISDAGEGVTSVTVSASVTSSASTTLSQQSTVSHSSEETVSASSSVTANKWGALKKVSANPTNTKRDTPEIPPSQPGAQKAPWTTLRPARPSDPAAGERKSAEVALAPVVVSGVDMTAEERLAREAELERRAEKEKQRLAAQEELERAKLERQRIAAEEEARKREEEKERIREAARLKAKKFEEERAARLASAAGGVGSETDEGSVAAAASTLTTPPTPKWKALRNVANLSKDEKP